MFAEAFVSRSEVRLLGFSHLGRFEDWRVFTMTSTDSGRTWTPPAEFPPLPRRAWPQARCVASWGEWLIPFISYEPSGDTSASPMDDGAVSRAFNGVLISGDQGHTWNRSGQTGPTAGWAENTVVELTDGALAMLVRADGTGHLLRSDSTDRGRTWSPPRPSGIPNPGTRCRLLRLADGRIVLLHNPCPTAGVRNPLAMWVSDDDMRTWPWRRVLTDFPGDLRYPDGFADEQEGFVHLAFDYNRHDVIYWAAELP
jgi:predicted neuraminidase